MNNNGKLSDRKPKANQTTKGKRGGRSDANTSAGTHVTRTPKDDPDSKVARYSGFIVISVKPIAKQNDKGKTLREFAQMNNLVDLITLLDDYKLDKSARGIESASPDEIRIMEKKAMDSEFPPVRSLTTYWRIDVRDRPDGEIDRIVYELRSGKLTEIIDQAYRESAASDPAVTRVDEPLNVNQGYLEPAPIGINANAAWATPGGDGNGINFVDIEQAWIVNHEDLNGWNLNPIYGNQTTDPGNHGAAVIGIVAASDNTIGIVGIAPNVSSVLTISRNNAATDDQYRVADAIVFAISESNPNRLHPGDVLLIEVEVNGLPAEVEAGQSTPPLPFHAIRLASGLGIIVIEPAGNRNISLDTGQDLEPGSLAPQLDFHGLLDHNSPTFQNSDSGAIMVGAGDSAVQSNGHMRWIKTDQIGIVLNGSNAGSRIDCYAWGNNIATCGRGDLGRPRRPRRQTGKVGTYTASFDGTSGASAIIAGVVLVIQSTNKQTHGGVLSPASMRSFLADAPFGLGLGTPQHFGPPGRIGRMPDLGAIIPLL